MVRQQPVSTRTDTLFPTRRSSDLLYSLQIACPAMAMPSAGTRTPKNAGERVGQRESTGWSGRSEAQPSEPRPVYSRCWGEGGRNVLSPLNKRHAGQRQHLVPEIRARDLARHVDRHRIAKNACGLGERSDESQGAAQAAGGQWLEL